MTPFACITEKLPEGFAINATNSEPVVFRGFFLKVFAYDSAAGRCGPHCSSAGWSASLAKKTLTRSTKNKCDESRSEPALRSRCLAKKIVSRSLSIEMEHWPSRKCRLPGKTWLENWAPGGASSFERSRTRNAPRCES